MPESTSAAASSLLGPIVETAYTFSHTYASTDRLFTPETFVFLFGRDSLAHLQSDDQ